MVFRTLPWQSSCVLFAMAASARIIASNSSTAISSFSGEIKLQDASGQNLSDLVPLTRDALTRNNAPLKGNLVLTNENTVTNLSTGDISYISCNPIDYQSNMDAFGVLNASMSLHNLTAVILYSTGSDYCGYDSAPEPLQEFPMFSMAKEADSQTVLNDINNLSVSNKFFVTISWLGSDKDSSNGGNDRPQQQNPLGPSPSTAVAMIILYSITGIITALFLVIIITGAVRAHRHPDRYGPRDVLGRPRQSRARGLGRAILDTIPIVKFGEREPPKPADVELGSTSEARNVNNNDVNAEGTAQPQNNQPETEAVETTDQTEAESRRDTITEQPSGIAPAEPLAGTSATAQENASDEGLGCSICTDDFEKGQDIRVLPCNHKFHPECVDPWLLNVSGTCPLCRVDLRPTPSHTSSGDDEQDPDLLAPPLQPEAETSHRRRSALRDILSLRSRPNASAEERISALRRLREQHRNQSGEVASGSESGSIEDIAAVRRSRRISARLSDVFSSRTRRQHSQDEPSVPSAAGPSLSVPSAEASSSSSQAPRADGPVPFSSNNDHDTDSALQRRL